MNPAVSCFRTFFGPRKGLTLLEVTIAVFVLVLIMTVLYGAYHSSVDSVRIAREGGEIRQTARLILERMSIELECAMAGKGMSLLGEDDEVNGWPADRLMFVSAAGREGGPDLIGVSYGLMPDPDGEGLILTRTEEGVIGSGNTTASRSYELARMVRGLDITYHDQEGREFEEWSTSSGEHGDLLPSLVLIRLALRGTAEEVHTFTTAVHPELSP